MLKKVLSLLVVLGILSVIGGCESCGQKPCGTPVQKCDSCSGGSGEVVHYED